jgi:hypothetical protein
MPKRQEMKSTLALLVLLLCSSQYSTAAQAVGGDFAVRTIFNNDQLLPTGDTCTVVEWDAVANAVRQAAESDLARRRQLRSAAWCAQACQGQRFYCILAGAGCTGKFRRLSGSKSSRSLGAPGVDLAANATQRPTLSCNDAVTNINKALDSLAPTLSIGCQAVLQTQRDFTCVEVDKKEIATTTTPSCQIQSFALWNADTDTVAVANFTSGSSFCRRPFRFGIQALTDPCIKRAQFDLVGTNGYHKDQTEFAAPFFSFGNKGLDIYGTRVKAGTYTLTVYPDEDVSRSRMLTFTVMDC